MTCVGLFYFILLIVYTNGQSERKISLTFVIDVTRSMETVRMQVEQNANAIFDTVVESNVSYIENFVLVTFADPYKEKYKASVNNVTITKNRDEFKDAFVLKLTPGGDCPEQSMSGIQTGIENSAPGSTIYVFTDAAAKDFNKFKYVKDEAQKKEIQVVFILTGKCNQAKFGIEGYKVYEDLAKATSGYVFDVLETTVVDIIKYIKDSIVERRIKLGEKYFSPGKDHTFGYTTDHATTDTTIIISCLDVSLKITGPDNNTLNVANLVKLEYVTVLKVNETKLGIQTVTISCKTKSHIVVTAKSDIKFRFGFSAFVPTSLNDTTAKPSTDAKTYLLIVVMGEFLPQTVQLIDNLDNLIINGSLPLKPLDNTQKLFLTEPFNAPKLFRIVVIGVNLGYNETIARIGTTLVEPQNPDTGVATHLKPIITIERGSKINVELDTPLQLKCTVNAYPRPKITWEKNGIILETDVFVHDLPYVYVSVHKMNKVNENATYVCKAKNNKGDDKKSVVVETNPKVVEEPAEGPIIEKTIKSLKFKEGKTNANINCRIKQGTPKPKIQWYYKDKDPGVFVKIKEAENQEYVSLATVNRSQEGIYKCVATNSVGNDTMESTLIVEYPPAVHVDSESRTVKADEEVTLTCSADGFPEPDVIWKKDGKTLIGKKFVSSSDHRLIFNANLDDNGAYECIAKNTLDSASKIINLIVEKPPKVSIKGTNPIDAEYDEPLNITCEVVGYPKPDIIWLDLTNKVELAAEVVEKRSYTFESQLFIGKITRNTTYQCKANNAFGGHDEKKVDVKTIRKPFFAVKEIPRDTIYEIPYNTTAKFICKADAYPPAEVNWYKNGDILSKDNISVSYDGFILTIKHMQPLDEGKFKCEIKNPHHNNTYPFRIKISGVVAPKIRAATKTRSILENSTTQFNCRIEQGTPKPTIEWYYKGAVSTTFVEIKKARDQENLDLTNITRMDRGTYKCVAINMVNNDSIEYTLIVKYPPTTVHVDSESKTVKADEEVTLTCSADGFPEPDVIWKKDGKILIGKKFVSSSDHRLIFKANLDDNGAYECIATNTLDSASKIISIKVEKQPTVTIEGDLKQEVYIGQAVYLKCNVIGNPAPYIYWIDTTNRAVLSGLTSLVKFPYEYINVLVIDKVDKTNNYHCVAENVHGDHRASVIVEAVMQKHFYVMEKPKDTVIAYEAKDKLYCKIDAYPPAKITWYKHEYGGGLSRLTNKDGIKISFNGSTLTFENMQPHHEGEYFCRAKNNDNTIMSKAKVTISGVELPQIFKTPDEITNHIRNYSVEEGTSVPLTCKIIRGKPMPTIKWLIKYKGAYKFIEIKKAQNQDTFLVTDVRRDNNAMYGCQVENVMGSDSLKMDLQVEYRPIIKKDKETYAVKEGARVDIPCSVDGKPYPIVKWTKNSSRLSLTTNMDHSFSYTTNFGDGYYTCTATNKYGNATRTVRIEVYNIRLTHRSKTQTVNQNETLELQCFGTGKPTPKIKWLYEGTYDDPKFPPKVLLDDNKTLEIEHITYAKRGRYTCVAYNSLGGRSQFTYEVDVYTSVTIHNKKDKIIRAVDGDKALRIYCNATGNPKPRYKWIINGVDQDDPDDTSTLLRLDVTKRYHANQVTCRADNDVDRDYAKFKIVIADYPSLNNPNSTLEMELGTSFPVACPIPHNKGEYLRWYKNKTKILEDEFYINDAKTSDSGLYTCRVSDIDKAVSANVILKLRSKLKFMNTDVNTTISLGFGETANLDCMTVGDSIPKMFWTIDGHSIKTTVSFYHFKMNQEKMGKYKCKATNGIDIITRIFDVTLNECLLKIDSNAKNQPLISTQHFKLPSYKYNAGYLYMPKFQTVLLICPKSSRFNLFDYDYVYAYCNKTAQLYIDETPYNYSDLQCTEELKPQVKWTGKSCLDDDSENVKIVYEVLNKNIEIYDVCMDLSNDIPLYSKQNLRSPLADSVPKAVSWFDDRLRINYDFDGFYDAKNQNDFMSSAMGRQWRVYDNCAFSRRQLVNPLDVFPGLPERATYTHLNVVPHWSTCSSENWNDIESRVRSLVQSTEDDLIVWTGTAKPMKLEDSDGNEVEIVISNLAYTTSQPVSTYLWKVVQNPKKKTAVAIIQLNIPDITKKKAAKYEKCRDITRFINWMGGSQWPNVSKGYTFCCLLQDFENAFGYRGLFGTGVYNLLQR